MSVFVIANLPVCAVSPARVACEPCAPVSDAPKPSTIMACGTNSSSASFSGGDRMAPPEPMTKSRDRSYDPRRSSSTSGRAKASPTIVSVLHRSRSTRPRCRRGRASPACPAGPRCRPGGARRTPSHCAAPCMSGGVGQDAHEAAVGVAFSRQLLDGRGPGHARRRRRSWRRGRCPPGARARPSACPSCRRCRGCRGRPATAAPAAARRTRRPAPSRSRARPAAAASPLLVGDLDQEAQLRAAARGCAPALGA